MHRARRRMPSRPRRALAAAVLATAAVAVAGCGGGDNGRDSGSGSASPAVSAPAGPSAASGANAPAVRGAAFVALGDSYAAGVRIPATVGTPAGCSRSDRNYASIVARTIGETSFTDVTCGGARTKDLTAPQTVAGGSNPPQFDALGPDTRLVTLGIGGNDIGFGEIVTQCSLGSIGSQAPAPCTEHYTRGGTDVLRGRIAATEPKVRAAVEGIRARSPQARILVVGYPAILPENDTACPTQLPIAVGDFAYLRGILGELNAMLSRAAAATGATYVDTYTPGVGHDVCRPVGVKWVEGIAPQSPAAPVHPNALGHEGMAEVLLASVRG